MTVILDAGHGGEDGGASTADGVLESGINLEMALRLAQGKTPAGTQVLAESAQHDPAALTALDETLRAE